MLTLNFRTQSPISVFSVPYDNEHFSLHLKILIAFPWVWCVAHTHGKKEKYASLAFSCRQWFASTLSSPWWVWEVKICLLFASFAWWSVSQPDMESNPIPCGIRPMDPLTLCCECSCPLPCQLHHTGQLCLAVGVAWLQRDAWEFHSLNQGNKGLCDVKACIRGNELVRANVSPQSRQNAEPEARTHPSTCPKCDPGWVSPLGISCSLQIERIRLNDSGVLLKSRNSMLWCVS